MAIRFDASGDYLLISSSLPNVDPVSACAWVYISVDRNNPGHILLWVNSGGTAWIAIGLNTDGTTLRINTATGSTTGTNLTAGVWYHVAITHNGTAMKAYLNGVIDINRTDSASFTLANFIMASNTVAWVNGRLAAVKVWNAELTADEIAREMTSILPRRFANLYGFWPMFPGASERLADYSGNGHTWTAGGTLADEDPPPVAWGAGVYSIPFVAGGTVYNITPTGVITPAGSIINRDNKILSGGVVPSGVIIKRDNQKLSGVITPGGIVIKRENKIIVGSVTPAGALANLKAFVRLFTGGITPSGILTRRNNKILLGGITPGGTLSKTDKKTMVGTVSPTGAMGALKAIARLFTGAITPAGALAKRVNLRLAGGMTPVGNLLKRVGKLLSGGVIPVGTLANLIGGIVTGIIHWT